MKTISFTFQDALNLFQQVGNITLQNKEAFKFMELLGAKDKYNAIINIVPGKTKISKAS